MVRSVGKLSVAIAPDSFKGSISATDAAAAIAEGWASIRQEDHLHLLPLADGGEGTLDAIEAALPDSRRMSAGDVTGPDGRPTPGEWLLLADGAAVIELAQMSGLPLMQQLDPLGATTFGMGEVIRAALDAGAERIIIGAGGSASTDAAAGALVALGLRLSNSREEPVSLGGRALANVATVDRSKLLAPPAGGVLVLTDVTAPLFGPTGAASVYGPQKGADPAQIERLDTALRHFADLLGGKPDEPGAGAAGGVGYGFATAWGATLTSGARYLLTLTGAEEILRDVDVVITGEGRFDKTSLRGKLVGEVIRVARTGRARIAVIAGAVVVPANPETNPEWTAALTDLAGSTQAAKTDPARWLREAGANAARDFGREAGLR